MKKIAFLIMFMLLSSVTFAQQPFFRRTKHKTITRMTNRQVKKVQKGKNLYMHKGSKVKKNIR